MFFASCNPSITGLQVALQVALEIPLTPMLFVDPKRVFFTIFESLLTRYASAQYADDSIATRLHMQIKLFSIKLEI